MSIRAGIDMARARLSQRATLVAAALALSFELGDALLERTQGALGAADRALSGGAFGIALPLFCYFLVARVCDGKSLHEALVPLARHGLDRRTLTLGLALVPALLAAVFAALSSIVVVLFTRSPGDPRLVSDAMTSLWIGLAAGVAYVAAFTGASTLGRRGQGRFWLLAADFVLGAGDSFLALPWPKGHIRNLLGGSQVLELSQLGALLVLLGTSFAFLWLGTLRNQR
ncbi:MAG TPA: hypothetical protein VNG33_15480 [Polyangiaceae bacterium]|nr:hypothetical protein [Polyangiaceae bacterium]